VRISMEDQRKSESIQLNLSLKERVTYQLQLYNHKRGIRKGQLPNSVFQLLWEFDEASEFGRHDCSSISVHFK
jgi:hypothetical protein